MLGVSLLILISLEQHRSPPKDVDKGLRHSPETVSVLQRC